jgi:zinc transport system substrate-binding protein
VLIYHPALGYLAESLSFNQIAVENEGKSPTPASLSELVKKVKAEGIEVMLYQKEYPLDIVQPIADILDVKLVEINPLSGDIIGEIDRIVNIIAGRYEQ